MSTIMSPFPPFPERKNKKKVVLLFNKTKMIYLFIYSFSFYFIFWALVRVELIINGREQKTRV